MSTDLPLACSLSADDLPRRLALISALGRDALVDRSVDGGAATLRFAADPGVRDRVEAIVAAEARCCAFLRMDVEDEPGAVVLRIDAPEGAEPVLADLVGAFAGASR